MEKATLTADNEHATISTAILFPFRFLFVFFIFYSLSASFDAKDSPDVAASLFHYPVLSALLHQFGQKHNLVEVALDLNLALCDCNLRD